MSISDRLKKSRASLGKSQKEMAALLGINFRTYENYEKAINAPSWDACEALVKLGLNANWVLTGEGKMWRDGFGPENFGIEAATDNIAAGNDVMNGRTVPDASKDISNGFVQIPRYEVVASAGGGAVIHSEQIVDHLSFKADWVRNALGVSVKELALINVLGDSMEPTLSDGDLILIDMSTSCVKDNAVYVLKLNGSLLVKRIQRMLDGSIIVMSDNSVYKPETVGCEAVDTLNVVGRVVWCGRRM